MKKIFLATLLGLILGENVSFAKKTSISDSLVDNLSCNSLSVGSILAKIRPEAFSFNNHISLRTWDFRSGSFTIGTCWGLSSTQRKLFYLMRFNEQGSSPSNAQNTKAILDMVRGASIEVTRVGENTQGELRDRNIKSYNVIPVAEQNLVEEYNRNPKTSFLAGLLKGVSYNMDTFFIRRNFITEVERSQERHFFRFKNIGMGAGTGPQTRKKNKETLLSLIANMSVNRLTLINLRVSPTAQHVVIAKSFTKDNNGNIWIQAYDSNHPESDQEIYFSKNTGQFYSPKIMGTFVGDYSGIDYSHPLGVFIVDEPERVQLEAALLKHYQFRCRQ